MYAISTSSLTKIYQTVPDDAKAHVRGVKERGPGLWVKNIFKLRTQKMRKIVAVRDLSFSVEVGEIFGIIGPNGAGKTTLIKLLSGLLYPTSGNAKILNYDLLDDHEKVKDKIAYVSTSGWMGLEWQLTAYENLLFYADLLKIPRKEAKTALDDVIESLGMVGYVGKTIPQLSAGMRQMLTIARGFIANRPIIYLDEPTTSLDPFAKEKMWNFVLKLKKNHSVIFSSHDPKELKGYADRIMIIKNGKSLIVSKPQILLKEFSTGRIYQAELSNANLSDFNETIRIIDAFSLGNKKLKLRFTLKGSLNDFITLLLYKKIVIHNITRDSPSISDVYARFVNE